VRTGLSPIGWTVYGNQLDSARILLDNGAVVNRAPLDLLAWGPTAHVANVQFAKLLLQHGADPNCPHQSSVLHGAEGRIDGDTPLHVAIKSRLVIDPTEFVQMLLAGGANPGIRNCEGRTPLDEALLQVEKTAEAYFPAKPTRPKSLERVIALLSDPSRAAAQ
jgi:ankyrin repeat protein